MTFEKTDEQAENLKAIEPAQSADAQPEPAEDEGPELVVLALTSPFYVNDVTLNTPDGGTLVIGQSGARVPADDAERLIADAAALGVTLTRK